ncbi:MAG TPA: ParA family protein [Planctomycetota bacterium]|nr:ParA family protein [Planctomycetota bacterium]
MRRIALVNQKGGVGKTTTAVNLAAGLASLGKRVLLIDLDPQSNATINFGLKPHELKLTTYSILVGGSPAPEVIRQISPNLFLIPASIDLAGAEMELSTQFGREQILRDAMKSVDDYDFCLVDCPPSLGILNVNGLVFVDEVFIPMQCEFFALHGLSLLVRTIEVVKKRLNPALAVTGVVPCMYDLRKGLAREIVKEIEKHFGPRVFRTRIRTNVRLAEAPSYGKSIFDYAPDSYGAEDYRSLAREVAGLPMEVLPLILPGEMAALAEPLAPVVTASDVPPPGPEPVPGI